jgi:hypothetical protein
MEFQHVEISVMEKVAVLLDKASTPMLFFPFKYSMSKSYAYTLLTHSNFLSFRSHCSKKYLKLLWSVLTTKNPHTRYYMNLANACIMANISLSKIR